MGKLNFEGLCRNFMKFLVVSMLRCLWIVCLLFRSFWFLKVLVNCMVV